MKTILATIGTGKRKIIIERHMGMYKVYLNDSLYASCSEYETARKNVATLVSEYTTDYMDSVIDDIIAV